MQPREIPATAPCFEFSGGALCLDFVNTGGNRLSGRNDTLDGWEELLRWFDEAEIPGRATPAALRSRARRRPSEARAAFRRAIALRELLYRLFSALAAGEAPAPADLDRLNAAVRRTLPQLRLEAGRDGFAWGWHREPTLPEDLLGPVVRSAVELLTSPEADRVRECAAARCCWLFVDRSRTHRRRWCSMKTCGNRAKARRHYRRRRQGRHPR